MTERKRYIDEGKRHTTKAKPCYGHGMAQSVQTKSMDTLCRQTITETDTEQVESARLTHRHPTAL